MTNKAKYRILLVIGIILCLLPPALTVISYFPLWKENHPSVLLSGVTTSGLSLGIMACVTIPTLAKWMKMITSKIKTPWFGLLIATIIIGIVKSVVDQLYIILCVATISNLCGWFIFIAAAKYKPKKLRREEGLRDE